MSNGQLASIVERIENLEQEKAAAAEAITDIYREAKSSGFDVKILRKVVAARKKTDAQRAEEKAIMDTYLHALGMLADTPLGQAALRKAGHAPAHKPDFE
jgi:uncharacterized protein (UPF0335 family)